VPTRALLWYPLAVRPHSPAVFLALSLLTACGSSSPSGPTPGTTPSPSSGPSVTVNGVVFYDENANGVLDSGENVRLPAVGLTVGGRAVVTGAGGHFTVDVPSGTQSAMATILPPFFRAAAPISLTTPPPSGFELAVPATLPILNNRPNTYLAFGDSITTGDGSATREGYRDVFAAAVRSFWGSSDVIGDGIESTLSDQGADRIGQSLAKHRPAYALILYGTNDWNNAFCRNAVKCFTVPSIRSMIQQCKANGTVPVVGTIIPANPAFVDRLAEDRNGWIAEMNGYIKAAVKEEGGVLADTNAAMMRAAGSTANLPGLFSDHVHPNDAGYDAIAQEFFKTVTTPVPAGQ
jgi:lysophospholipase L1-like esterase